jgi:hypothetical protein
LSISSLLTLRHGLASTTSLSEWRRLRGDVFSLFFGGNVAFRFGRILW